MRKKWHLRIRRIHRYLGIILGIQFLMWTIGGLYFSWSNIDEIHGDFQKKEVPLLSSQFDLVSPKLVIENIRKIKRVDSLVDIRLVQILGTPFYQVIFISAENPLGKHHQTIQLADAITGALRNPLTKDEAVQVASQRFNGEPKVKSVEYLTSTNTHHEYRGSPLPAYAITFNHASNTVVYVASELGTVQKFRNSKWRIFDFLYMMHTMDYQSRDNFNNLLLRIFSLFGLVTVMSGFILFWASSKWFKKKETLMAV